MPITTRRQILAAGAALTGAALTGCAGPDSGSAKKATAGEITAENPLGVPADKPVEIVIFDGGFGDKYATAAHEPMLKAKHPTTEIKHTSTKEVAKTLLPRFAAGSPPDVVNNDGAGALDFGALVQDGQLADLTPLLDAPAWDVTGKKVRDLLSPAAIERGTYNGKFVAVNYVAMSWGIWYSTKLFEKHGWQPPKTWPELLALCERVKAAGVAPFSYAGKHAEYLLEPLLTMAAKVGGNDVLVNIDNLADGAWKAEPVRQAAAAWQEIGAKYLLVGTQGLNHTESQAKHNAYQVAMLPCGAWLENEQKSVAPDDFGYAMFPVPSLTGSDRLPQATLHAAPFAPYFVPARAANPSAGMEYLRAMVSTEGATKFTELTSTLTTVQGATGSALRPGLKSAATALAAAGQNVVTWRFEEWYKELFDAARSATTELMSGRIDAAAFCDRIQKKADEVRADSSVKKQRR